MVRSTVTLSLFLALIAVGTGVFLARPRFAQGRGTDATRGAKATATREPTEASIGFGYRSPLASAESLVVDDKYNPQSLTLTGVQRLQLEKLVSEMNAQLDAVQSEIEPAARRWAELCRANEIYIIPHEGHRHPGHGVIIVSHLDRYGITRDVVIRPGDCAEIDVLMADADALAQIADESTIRLFLSIETTCNRKQRSPP